MTSKLLRCSWDSNVDLLPTVDFQCGSHKIRDGRDHQASDDLLTQSDC